MIIATNGGGKKWLNNRVNLSLIFNHTASLFASSAPKLTTSATGLFRFRSLPQSNVILLMKAAMVGVRPNISTATAQDIRIVRCLIVRLININSLIRLNSLETNPNGLRFFWSPGFYITKHLVHVEDISQNIRWVASTFFHDTQWIQDLLVGGFCIAWKTIIILPRLNSAGV